MGTSLGVADTMALIASKLTKIVPWSSCALFLQPIDFALNRRALALTAHPSDDVYTPLRVVDVRLPFAGDGGDQIGLCHSETLEQRSWRETPIFVQFPRKIQHRSRAQAL